MNHLGVYLKLSAIVIGSLLAVSILLVSAFDGLHRGSGWLIFPAMFAGAELALLHVLYMRKKKIGFFGPRRQRA
jgi:hypothetical protein